MLMQRLQEFLTRQMERRRGLSNIRLKPTLNFVLSEAEQGGIMFVETDIEKGFFSPRKTAETEIKNARREEESQFFGLSTFSVGM